MKAAVVVFPGSNCDRDCKVAIERSAGARVEMVWHQETALPDDLDLIVLPGGFSYGDYLRCGAMAALSPVMKDVVAAADKGVAVVGIYDDHEVWERLGYEGASFDQGGYLHRGFDDLDWLPDPRIEEYDGHDQLVEVAPDDQPGAQS